MPHIQSLTARAEFLPNKQAYETAFRSCHPMNDSNEEHSFEFGPSPHGNYASTGLGGKCLLPFAMLLVGLQIDGNAIRA